MPYDLLLMIYERTPLRVALFIDNYDFMTTCVRYLRLNNVRLYNSTYDTLIVCPSFSTPCSFCPSFSSPANSSPALLCIIFHSCIFLSCKFSRPFGTIGGVEVVVKTSCCGLFKVLAGKSYSIGKYSIFSRLTVRLCMGDFLPGQSKLC